MVIWNTKLTNGEALSDSVMRITELGCFGQKTKILGEESKFWVFCIKSHILIWNTKLTDGDDLGDSLTLKMELGGFGLKIKILHFA